MSYEDAIGFLYGLSARGVKLNLDRIRTAIELRGHPERGLRVVHVAGTNGKGSVAATVAACARAAGAKVGLNTSPHLHRYSERLQVDGAPLSDDEIVRRVADIRRAMGASDFPPLTFFEITTLLALESFRDHGCDVAVMEVGLGGRLDATNVVEPAVTVITRIAIDHRKTLGTTTAAIAAEKAGILKPGVPLVASTRDADARAVVEARAAELGVPGRWIGEDFDVVASGDGVDVRVGAETHLRGLRPALPGAHQHDNVACAAASCVQLRAAGLDIPDAAIAEGIATVRWPGRMEHIAGAPAALLDCAHNPDACEALAHHLDALPQGRRVLLFGAMRDKDLQRMLGLLDGRVDERVYTAPDMPRAAEPGALATIRPGEIVADPAAALARARELAGPAGLVVVAGSIFVVATARALLVDALADPPIAM